LQFHFHSLSEHFLFGEQFDLELHLVHRSADGDLLVIGRFVVPGDRLEELDEGIAAIEAGGGFEVKDFDLDVFIPSRRTSYRYRGSTTTPPCTEGVQWILMTEPLELSEDQIERIQLALQDINEGFDNARPLLSRNGRYVEAVEATDIDTAVLRRLSADDPNQMRRLALVAPIIVVAYWMG
jgi:carbonic anhydrase